MDQRTSFRKLVIRCDRCGLSPVTGEFWVDSDGTLTDARSILFAEIDGGDPPICPILDTKDLDYAVMSCPRCGYGQDVHRLTVLELIGRLWTRWRDSATILADGDVLGDGEGRDVMRLEVGGICDKLTRETPALKYVDEHHINDKRSPFARKFPVLHQQSLEFDAAERSHQNDPTLVVAASFFNLMLANEQIRQGIASHRWH